MLTRGTIIEDEFQKFLKAGYEGRVHTLHPMQLTELRRAFYGGAVVGTLHNPQTVKDEAQYFFNDEIRKYKEDISRTGAEL